MPLVLVLAWYAPSRGSTPATKPKPAPAIDSQAGPRLDPETMKMALKTVSAQEQGFVEKVVWMSKEGKLPPIVVDEMFEWARKKPNYQFEYFKRGLTIRAAALGVDVNKPLPKKVAKSNSLRLLKPGDYGAILKLGPNGKSDGNN
jgi:hypothetical protein